jgi:choice-of-anchor B domain-containing protein
LQVFDLSGLPATVTKVYESYEHFDRAHNIFIDTATAKMYVAGARDSTLSRQSNAYNGVMIFDLSQKPDTPALLSSTRLQGGYIHDLYARNDTLYGAHIYNGVLGIYDLRNPAISAPLASFTSYPGQGYTHSMWLRDQGDILVFADETHGSPLKSLDVSDLGNLSLTAIFSSSLEAPTATNSIAHNPIFRGDSVYISYYHDGVQVFDLTNPAYPQRVAYYDTYNNSNYNGYSGCWGVYPLLPSGLILSSDISTGLYVLEMLNPPLAADQLELQLVSGGKNGPRLRASRLSASAKGELILERKQQVWTHIATAHFPEDKLSYEFDDAQAPQGSLRYRLRLKLADGQVLHSNEVEYIQAIASAIEIAKNPVAVGEPIVMILPTVSFVQVFDLQGKLLAEQQFQAGSHSLDLSLQPGVYLVRANGEMTSWQYLVVSD